MNPTATRTSVANIARPLTRGALALVIGPVIGLGACGPAAAEGFADIGLGAAFIASNDVRITQEGAGGGRGKDRIAFDPSLSVRFRVGNFFESAPWFGAGASISYFEAEGHHINHNRLVPITGLVMFRAPLLTDEAHPNGRVQPYIALGPSVVFSDIAVEAFGGASRSLNQGTVDLGFEAQAGVAFAVTERMRLFVEYALTYVRQSAREDEFEFDWWDSNDDVKAKVDVLASHVVLGVSFAF